MSSILEKLICLKLNQSWQSIGFVSVRDSVTFLCSEKNGERPGLALDIETKIDENGETQIVYANPVPWETWITLPVREGDLYISTGKGKIRAPLVVICANYAEVPKRTIRWSNGNVHKRDGYTCAYTNKKLSHANATVDHIIPKSRGGRDDWKNTVTCDKAINAFKANRTPEEAGLKLLRKPTEPKPMPVIFTIEDAKHPFHRPFLLRN